MTGSDNTGDRRLTPKVWGRRPYAGKEARELLNDVSRQVARTRPADVDNPADPSLADVLRHAGDGLDGTKGQTLVDLMGEGLDFQEAVVWYWFRYCRFDVTEIHYAINGSSTGGDHDQRRQSARNITGVLKSAAAKLPDENRDDVPDLVDDRKRHDRTDDDP